MKSKNIDKKDNKKIGKKVDKQKIKKDYFKSLFEEWKNKGYGSGQAYKAYQSIKETIPKKYRWRKTDFLKAYREYAKIKKKLTPEEIKMRAYKHTRYDRRPTEKSIIYNMNEPFFDYIHVAKVTLEDDDTGERSEKIISIGAHERPLTKNEVEEKIIKVFEDNKEAYNKHIVKIEHIAVYSRKRWW